MNTKHPQQQDQALPCSNAEPPALKNSCAITAPAGGIAKTLNQNCFCLTLNAERLREQLESDASLAGLAQNIAQTRPHLFSSTVVFMSGTMASSIAATVAAIERVIALPAYQAQALARAPVIAQQAYGPLGVFMGVDFHLGPQGPRLIEINTNAGGALLNVALARAQQACCEAMDAALVLNELPALEQTFCAMFVAEWQQQRGNTPLRSLVIVDDAPATQYLAPEFELFQEMFRRHGIAASIADPAELEWRDGLLWHRGGAVDLVYNRLTDFYLEQPEHAALQKAYAAAAVVLTPHPRAHALHADKRNLVTLSNDALLASWGVAPDDRALFQAVVPKTQIVTAENADALWAQRRQLFFKPVAGYAGRAAWRGDKLTRRVWGEILAGDFVAQALVAPGERAIKAQGGLSDLKFDIRAYAYAGRVQLFAARMYAGQTTNFRTAGGGFAPVIVVPDIHPAGRTTTQPNTPA